MLEQTVTANGGISRRVTNLGGPKHAADILNHFPTALSESILGSIKIKDDKTSEKIRENLFTFQDLGKLSDRALQILLREIPGEKLASALRLVEESLRARFYQNLSSRQVEVLKEELRTAPPIRRSDALSAQGEILESALKLASEGKISIGSTDDLI
jgi:flagellar motor switch protein FliG